jgi:hypothetical protein
MRRREHFDEAKPGGSGTSLNEAIRDLIRIDAPSIPTVAVQACRLVRHGPYRLIRHPLYVAEEISIRGAVLHFLSPLTTALFVLHCAIQIRRMMYEESVLTRVFPKYQYYYAASTARVIPKFGECKSWRCEAYEARRVRLSPPLDPMSVRRTEVCQGSRLRYGIASPPSALCFRSTLDGGGKISHRLQQLPFGCSPATGLRIRLYAN